MKMNKDKIVILFMGIIIIILSMAIILSKNHVVNKSGILLTNEGREKVQHQPLSIKGFSEISVKSGDLEQDFDYCNPKGNNCYMNVELLLNDGSNLFEIKKLEPNYGIKKIKFLKTIEKGTYEDCTFNVYCYSMDDGSQLNGATMKVTIYAR